MKKLYKHWSLVSAFPETGRTHQIRVHFQYLGHPLVGDPEYAPGMESPVAIIGQALHSFHLSFTHPVTEQQMELEAPLPADMEELIDKMEMLSEE